MFRECLKASSELPGYWQRRQLYLWCLSLALGLVLFKVERHQTLVDHLQTAVIVMNRVNIVAMRTLEKEESRVTGKRSYAGITMDFGGSPTNSRQRVCKETREVLLIEHFRDCKRSYHPALHKKLQRRSCRSGLETYLTFSLATNHEC